MADCEWYGETGYWVSPEGVIHQLVSWQHHEETAEDILRGRGVEAIWERRKSAWTVLTEEGWTPCSVDTQWKEARVTVRPQLSGRTAKMRDALIRIFREHGRRGFTTFVVDGGGLDCATFDDSRRAIGALQKMDLDDYYD